MDMYVCIYIYIYINIYICYIICGYVSICMYVCVCMYVPISGRVQGVHAMLLRELLCLSVDRTKNQLTYQAIHRGGHTGNPFVSECMPATWQITHSEECLLLRSLLLSTYIIRDIVWTLCLL